MINPVFYQQLDRPCSRQQIIQDYCSGKKVLDIGCVNHRLDNANGAAWLHGHIRKVARELVGLDILENDVRMLRERGYAAHCADVTRPIPLNGTFDVVVVGNLIEHLSNFEGLWDNLSRLLADRGAVLVSTANPFYREQ